ncbi:Polyadenylate-binding protein-interacting protein 11 [Glycine soja]|uniref:Polyadenylate-binding protein-interacting protein 11 n=1 Tax=Glycine soja TaxID=3848 RepID=A0A445LR55_GLYSO|nr:Polyadenylate-binding protein-interacting protein 11 [Glycine soja]
MRFFLCLHLTTLQSSILPSFLQLRCTEFLDLHFGFTDLIAAFFEYSWVTEEQLAALFLNCGQVEMVTVVDCRVCGDPNSILRFAFIEFTDEEGARAALNLSGTMLGYYPLRVLPSKTAIVPVNPTFLPRSEDEREMCSRTIYCTNIDKKVGKIETEKMLIQMVETELEKRKQQGTYKGGFRGQSHFFGYSVYFRYIILRVVSYEGRCGLPTNFDSIYCYALGYGAAAFLQSGKTEEWTVGGTALTSLMDVERRHVIIRSNTDTGSRGRSSFVLIGCGRSSLYKCRNKEFVRRDTESRKCGCPFRLRGKPVHGGEGWMVKLICGIHNHELAKSLVGHPYAGRLTKDEKKIIADTTKSMVKPKNILLTLKEHNAHSCTTIKQIYNARSAYRSSIRGVDTEMQHQMKLLERDQYIH